MTEHMRRGSGAHRALQPDPVHGWMLSGPAALGLVSRIDIRLTRRLETADFGDAAADGLDGCLDAVVEVELGEDAGDVVVDGVGAERELVRDLVIALAAGEAGEDLQFAHGQGGPDRAGGVMARGGDGDVPLADAL